MNFICIYNGLYAHIRVYFYCVTILCLRVLSVRGVDVVNFLAQYADIIAEYFVKSKDFLYNLFRSESGRDLNPSRFSVQLNPVLVTAERSS